MTSSTSWIGTHRNIPDLPELAQMVLSLNSTVQRNQGELREYRNQVVALEGQLCRYHNRVLALEHELHECRSKVQALENMSESEQFSQRPPEWRVVLLHPTCKFDSADGYVWPFDRWKLQVPSDTTVGYLYETVQKEIDRLPLPWGNLRHSEILEGRKRWMLMCGTQQLLDESATLHSLGLWSLKEPKIDIVATAE
mmetsp:Transcript_46462/g.86867  ORF Transcript_46462/g.86867 Transcript_46462/m.86867 type:complete len:196 (+) Transcript_46462:109-696(+)